MTAVTHLPGASIDALLAAARHRLRRLTPGEAVRVLETENAVIADIRPERHRRLEGMIPGSIVVERNVLEWRFDPASSARLSIAGPDLTVIVVCNEGYTSSLAAAALHDLGVSRATDLVGGFRAWRAAGLPITYDEGAVVDAG